MFSFTADQRYNCLHFQGQVWARTINMVRPGVQKHFICKKNRERTKEADRSRISLNNNYRKQRSLFSFCFVFYTFAGHLSLHDHPGGRSTATDPFDLYA